MDLRDCASVPLGEDTCHLANDRRVGVADRVELRDAPLGCTGWNGREQSTRSLRIGRAGRASAEGEAAPLLQESCTPATGFGREWGSAANTCEEQPSHVSWIYSGRGGTSRSTGAGDPTGRNGA